ncbi:hypothetical protein [Streptomyces sp. G1]|uniref:hypothetical protein n=1 Tax=Streptomyces sp. G1 TaxID=361572 RepID=UPI00202EF109|nr:hypothetical protein [Streptomyces sp. G1]MCM1973025.1 hypothetical protein [Streptomyces sp. G1]
MTVDQANTALAALYAADESLRVRPIDGKWSSNTEGNEGTVELRSVVFGPPQIAAGADLSHGTDIKVTLLVLSGVAILRTKSIGAPELITKVWVFSGAATETMGGSVNLSPSTSSPDAPVLDLSNGSWSWSLLDTEDARMNLGLGFRDHLRAIPPVRYDLGTAPAGTSGQAPPTAAAPVAITKIFESVSPLDTATVRASAAPGTAPTWNLEGIGNLSADGQTARYTAPVRQVQLGYGHTVITARVADTAARTHLVCCMRTLDAVVLPDEGAEVIGGQLALKLVFVVEGEDGDEQFEKTGTEVEWTLTGQGTLTERGVYTPPEAVTEPSIAFISGRYRLAGILTFTGYHVVVLTAKA